MSHLISEQEFNRRLTELQLINESKERELQLKKEENKYKRIPKLPSTSKLMAVYCFILFNVIAIYAMVAMWHFQDLQYLGVLIADIAGQVMTYGLYANKSKAENTTGGIIYETAMHKLHQDIENVKDTEDTEEESVG